MRAESTKVRKSLSTKVKYAWNGSLNIQCAGVGEDLGGLLFKGVPGVFVVLIGLPSMCDGLP